MGPTSASQWLWLVGLGVIRRRLSFVLCYSAYRHLPVVTSAVVAFVYPLVALLLDFAIYGPRPGLLQFAGLALIVPGPLGVRLKWSPRASCVRPCIDET